MIAIDLYPLVADPRRGVARALTHLLHGLAAIPRPGVRVEGFLPRGPTGDTGPSAKALGLERIRVPDAASLRPRAWRAALARELETAKARVLLSPWVAYPRTKVPVVAWVHEVPFARHGSLEGRLRTLRHRRALARAAKRAAGLVVPADAVRTDLLGLHPEAGGRVHVVPHGFEPSPWTVRRETPADPLPAVPAAGTYVLMVGTGRGAGGAYKKGLDLFVRLFDHGTCGGLSGVVVGAAPDLPSTIKVLPDLPDSHLAYVLERARVLVVPSRSEGFGYPMLEGFAAGVPVVASAAGALPEVSGGAARLVPPGDAGALAESVARVATDEILRERMIKAGKRRAQEFPVEAMARDWLRVLTKAGGIAWPG